MARSCNLGLDHTSTPYTFVNMPVASLSSSTDSRIIPSRINSSSVWGNGLVPTVIGEPKYLTSRTPPLSLVFNSLLNSRFPLYRDFGSPEHFYYMPAL